MHAFHERPPTEPQCGFSRKMIALLKENSIDHGHFDILTDNEAPGFEDLQQLANVSTTVRG